MTQQAIWRHFQNSRTDSFAEAQPRLHYLAAQFTAGQAVLNIGVGAGQFEELSAARGLQVYSLDPDAESIERLRNRLALGERAMTGSAERIPLPADSLDGVVMSEVLEHLDPQQLAATLVEVARVLRPGGRFIGTVPDNEDLAAGEVLCPHCAKAFHRWGHQQAFDAAGLAALLADAGFRAPRVRPRLFPSWRHLNWKGKLAWALRSVAHAAGAHSSHAKLVFAATR